MTFPPIIITTTMITPPAPMNADYYDDINPSLTKIETPKMSLFPPPMMNLLSGPSVLKPHEPPLMNFLATPSSKNFSSPAPLMNPLHASPMLTPMRAPLMSNSFPTSSSKNPLHQISLMNPLHPPPVMERGNIVFVKPAVPKPLPLLRDVRPIGTSKWDPLGSIKFEKKAKIFPTLFDLFKLPALPSFAPKQLGPPFGDVERLRSPFSRRSTFSMKVSPPVSWTYCEPICGTGDQAVDAESALDNARFDIKEGLADALTLLQLSPLRDEDVNIIYDPKSTILEEAGKNSYDYMGFYYVTLGSAVGFRRHRDEPSKSGAFHVEIITAGIGSAKNFFQVKVKIQHNNINSAVLKQVANKLSVFLQSKKGARISGDIIVLAE